MLHPTPVLNEKKSVNYFVLYKNDDRVIQFGSYKTADKAVEEFVRDNVRILT